MQKQMLLQMEQLSASVASLLKGTGPQQRAVPQAPPPQPAATATKKAQAQARTTATRQQ
ncbi:hypothetical protein HaLaN_31306, partial [Haematococcus lacustris]